MKKSKYIIKNNLSIKQAIKHMKSHGLKSLFIINEKSKLIGSISGGDIRGAILKKKKLSNSIKQIIQYSPKFIYDGSPKLINKKLKIYFKKYKIQNIPILNKDKTIKDIISWNELIKTKTKVLKKINKLSNYNFKVVIMAGGKGSRLKPFTDILPKPLIPIKKKTIIEYILNNFIKYGLKKFIITTNYKSEILKSYLIDKFSKNLFQFVKEKKPSGTVGSLKLIKSNSSLLVSNCDVFHKIKLNKFLDFHFKNKNDISLVVAKKRNVVPYGVCEINNTNHIISLKEKPTSNIIINTGLYIIGNKTINLIPKNKFYDFNDLISLAIEKKFKIGAFKIRDNEWYDIGRWDEYSKTKFNIN